ncbi:MAG: DUF2183 domain-containing protein [Sumerlaeia bacterium]
MSTTLAHDRDPDITDPTVDEGARNRLQRWLKAIAWALEVTWDRTWRALSKKLGRYKPTRIVPYRGYSNGRRAFVNGRVFADSAPRGAEELDSWRDNLRAAFKRWVSREVPKEPVEARIGETVLTTRTDEEGYFDFTFDLEETRCVADRLWERVELRLPRTPPSGLGRGAAIETTGQIMCPTDSARFGVISDMDDTVLRSHITNIWRAARLAFLKNAKTRQPFEGISEFYRALQAGTSGHDGNPIFYVSSSAWNLYDLLEEFLAHNDIPAGPIMLQDVGLDRNRFISAGHSHKLEKARQIINTYPSMPFVLVGDSGQHDPFLYLRAAREFGPERIAAIYIRDVHSQWESEKHERRVRHCAAEAENLGVPMLLVEDSAAAAEHAAGLGLIDSGAVARVLAQCRSDREVEVEV